MNVWVRQLVEYVLMHERKTRVEQRVHAEREQSRRAEEGEGAEKASDAHRGGLERRAVADECELHCDRCVYMSCLHSGQVEPCEVWNHCVPQDGERVVPRRR